MVQIPFRKFFPNYDTATTSMLMLKCQIGIAITKRETNQFNFTFPIRFRIFMVSLTI
nr:MAG TPA: hypothetical protein [Caudoviricetes sp.]